ncbi:MAG: FAD binding domain-containing protein [bacterium]
MIRPGRLDEAVAARQEAPLARIVGGGTLVVAERSLGIADPPAYLLLSSVAGLDALDRDEQGWRIGSMVRLSDLAERTGQPDGDPMLARALRSLATPQIRNQATVGGNIAEGRPAHTLGPCLVALGATVAVAGPAGTTEHPIARFLAAGAADDEVVVGVTVPSHAGFARYARVAPRNGPGYATASIAIAIDGAARSVRTGLGGVGRTTLSADVADAYLVSVIDWDAATVPGGTAEEYGRLLAQGCDPVTDERGSAEYRRHAVRVMGRRLVEDWAEEAQRGR